MEKDIDRIPKNPDTDIVIRIDDYGGKRGLTIREFIRGERYTGFTKAGTRIPADKFKLFKDAINSINEKELLEMSGQEALTSEAKGSAKSKESDKKKSDKIKVVDIDDIEEQAM